MGCNLCEFYTLLKNVIVWVLLGVPTSQSTNVLNDLKSKRTGNKCIKADKKNIYCLWTCKGWWQHLTIVLYSRGRDTEQQHLIRYHEGIYYWKSLLILVRYQLKYNLFVKSHMTIVVFYMQPLTNHWLFCLCYQGFKGSTIFRPPYLQGKLKYCK